MKARIFEIKHFAVHDGNGIRTTVFFKGCPLRCKWCHNPEGLAYKINLAYYEHLCTHCGYCEKSCSYGVHYINQKEHILRRESCISCGKCVSACPTNALKLYGKDVTIEDILPELLQDKDFYETSNGGVTLSGGECLLQPDFCTELLKTLKEHKINTAVDTCGFVPRENIDKVLPFTDTFLYDLKAFDEDIHIAYTGQSNKLILENLEYISSLNKGLEIRIPFIPTVNDKQIDKMGVFLSKLSTQIKIRLLPYHDYYFSKYKALKMENNFIASIPSDSDMENAKLLLKSYGCNVLE